MSWCVVHKTLGFPVIYRRPDDGRPVLAPKDPKTGKLLIPCMAKPFASEGDANAFIATLTDSHLYEAMNH